MPQSKDSPAAIVCVASKAEVPEEAGSPPPEERTLDTLADVARGEDDDCATLGTALEEAANLRTELVDVASLVALEMVLLKI